MKKILWIALFCLFGASSASLAHKGGLDGNGCHESETKGQFHCHEGALKGKSFKDKREMNMALLSERMKKKKQNKKKTPN